MRFFAILLMFFFTLNVHSSEFNDICGVKSTSNVSVHINENTLDMLVSVKRYAAAFPKIDSGTGRNPIIHKMLATQRLVFNAAIGDVSQIKKLLEQGTFVDSRWVEPYYTALAAASVCGRVDAVKLLIRSGADVNSKIPFFNGRDGQVTLSSVLSVVRSLDVDFVRSDSDTKEVIEILVKSGARAEDKDVDSHENLDEIQLATKWYRQAGFKDSYSFVDLR